MKQTMFEKLLLLFFVLLLILGCTPNRNQTRNDQPAISQLSIGVFVPGVVEGSPTYEMMVNGVRRAVKDGIGRGKIVQYQVFEAGFNQAEWQSSLTSLVASGAHDFIVTSNPSMPEIVAAILPQFPNQKFIILDSYAPAIPQIRSIFFNQYEQAYLSGFLAALISDPKLGMSGANNRNRIALLAGQEYPVMNQLIRPGFLAGAQSHNPDITLDFRVLGNWFDASRASDLVRSTISGGADVVLTIAGGGNQGAIAAAAEAGTYVLWFDSSGYSFGPGTVLGSTLVLQEEFAYKTLQKAIDGTLEFGVAEVHGIRDGAVSFDFDSPEYRTFLPMEIRTRFENRFEEMLLGTYVIDSPTFQ
jgi:basic membrane lipoprotein Med (substrate-binding protein (PBP1-ABC) superfamily)